VVKELKTHKAQQAKVKLIMGEAYKGDFGTLQPCFYILRETLGNGRIYAHTPSGGKIKKRMLETVNNA